MLNTVRLAMPAEAVDIARIQRHAWGQRPSLRSMLARISADQASQVWHKAITKPQLATMRVLVALGEGGIVGFVATTPSEDPDASTTTGEIAELVVDRGAGGQGHDARLMQAAIDTLRSDGFDVATMWIESTDDSMRELLVSTGWAADGAHRESGMEEDAVAVKFVRLHTAIGS